ncbi:unnamed protein product, partial [Amoebophrya sp. A25]
GRGGSAEVYEVTKDGRRFAIKIVSARNTKHLEGFRQEVELLERFSKRPEIIRCYGSRALDLKLYILLEYAECDFHQYAKRFPQGMALKTIAHCWSQMLAAVKIIHEANIVHFDLKPANFLLSDFGLARAVQPDMTHISRNEQCGTIRYMAPEAFYQPEEYFSSMKMTPGCDVWSLGIILYALIYLKTPYEHFEG